MRKIILLGLFYILSFCTYSQSTIPVQIILIENDTLKGQMFINVNAFDNELIYKTSFNEKVIFFNRSGEKRKIKSKEIFKLTFIDLKGNNRKFVKIKEFKNHIVEEIYSNKIRWYKHHYTMNSAEYAQNIIFDENGQKFKIGLFSNYRKKLRKLTKENPEINKFINKNEINRESEKSKENIIKVFKMYEDTI